MSDHEFVGPVPGPGRLYWESEDGSRKWLVSEVTSEVVDDEEVDEEQDKPSYATRFVVLLPRNTQVTERQTREPIGAPLVDRFIGLMQARYSATLESRRSYKGRFTRRGTELTFLIERPSQDDVRWTVDQTWFMVRQSMLEDRTAGGHSFPNPKLLLPEVPEDRIEQLWREENV